MKARLVKENIEFKRTGDTKQALNLGFQNQIIEEDLANLIQIVMDVGTEDKEEILEYMDEEMDMNGELERAKLLYLIDLWNQKIIFWDGSSFDSRNDAGNWDIPKDLDMKYPFLYNAGEDLFIPLFSKIEFPKSPDFFSRIDY